jgi:hypothetical protein
MLLYFHLIWLCYIFSIIHHVIIICGVSGWNLYFVVFRIYKIGVGFTSPREPMCHQFRNDAPHTMLVTQIGDTKPRCAQMWSSLIRENGTHPHHWGAKLAQWRVKRRRSSFWCVSVKFIYETCPLQWQKGDTHSYCASLIMQVKETRVARGVSPFITKRACLLFRLPSWKRAHLLLSQKWTCLPFCI